MSDQPDLTPKIKLNLTHSNLTHMRVPEVRFDLYELIYDVKKLCEKKFGTKADSMQLVLQDNNGNNVVTMNEDDRTLDFYAPQQLYTIHVIDLDPNSITKELEDLSQVPKYEMSDEEYNKRPNTMRKWKAEYLQKHQHEEEELDDNYMQAEAEQFTVGARCKLLNTVSLGYVAYVGLVPELSKGYFVGVKLDSPIGNNDGVLDGKHYFDCQHNHGIFMRPTKVELGNFPVYNDDDEI